MNMARRECTRAKIDARLKIIEADADNFCGAQFDALLAPLFVKVGKILEDRIILNRELCCYVSLRALLQPRSALPHAARAGVFKRSTTR
jgi:hypothetical protein